MASSQKDKYADQVANDDELPGEADAAAAAAAALSAEDAERLGAMSQEERERQRRDWCAQLEKTEEEIQTLKQVLHSKIRRANDLKRKLGITVFGELRSDFLSSWQHIKGSGTYQRTASAAKGAKERTSEITHSMASKVSQRWSSMRNSNAFKSMEGRVGNAYTNVKDKIVGGGGGGEGDGGAADSASASGDGGAKAAGGGASASQQQQQQQQQKQQEERLRQLAEAGGVGGDDADD